jgi:predicted NAD/FAD-dependent oxidoreductase
VSVTQDSSGRDPLAAAAAAENCATLPTPTYLFAQRWGHGYAAKALQLRERCACFEGAHRVVSCGDFCAGGGVDGAALSGLAAGRKLHALLHL